jgi:Zn-dependent protease
VRELFAARSVAIEGTPRNSARTTVASLRVLRERRTVVAEAGALPGPRGLSQRRPRASTFGPRGLELGKIGGIPLRIDPSWLLIFALVAWSAAIHFPSVLPGVSLPLALLMGTVASLVLFASVLVHELSHSLTAVALGYEVRGIKLFIFGGVSEIGGEPRTARDEALIAIVGPLSSAVIAGALEGARYLPGLGPAASALLGYLALANVALAVFNMFPGLPLDGGRVLRAVFRAGGSDLFRATRHAAAVGRALGVGFIAIGLTSFALGGGFGGLWLALVGWFLRSSADSSYRTLEFRERLESLRASDLALRVRPLAREETIREALIDRGLLASDFAYFPVAEGDRFLGLVAIEDLRCVPRNRWDLIPVGALETRPAAPSVQPDTPLVEALDFMAREGQSEIAVTDSDGAWVGLLRLEDLVRLASNLGERVPARA